MKSMHHRKEVLIVFFLVLCASCRQQPAHVQSPENTENTFIPQQIVVDQHAEKQKPCIVVFIHGTMFPLPSVNAFIASFKLFFNSSDSWITAYYDALRYKSTFADQPVGLFGLHPIGYYQRAYEAYLAQVGILMSDVFMSVWNAVKPAFKSKIYMYTFGWDGALSRSHRCAAAEELYQSLTVEVARLASIHGCAAQDVDVFVMGHSHGGNVALLLADKEKKYGKSLTIKTLVLLGTPVQSETEYLVKEPIFEHIINLYSPTDIVQVIDCISTRDTFSRRCVDCMSSNHGCKPLLTQLEVSIDGKGPGHAEFWLLCGKYNYLSRQRLSISPFPLVLFVPVIMQALSKNASFSHMDVSATAKDYVFSFRQDMKNQLSDNHYEVLIPKNLLACHIQRVNQLKKAKKCK